MMKGSGSIQIMMDPDPEGPKIYGSGFTTLLSSFERKEKMFRREFLELMSLFKVNKKSFL
jgi:hypothetical protein